MMKDELQKLKEENEKLKERDELRSELISLSAHDLRTSLSTFKWVLKMFLDDDLGKLSDEQKEYIRNLYEENERTLGVIEEMLELNRAEDIALKYEFEEFEIEPLIKETVEQFQAMAKKKEVALSFEEPNKFSRVKADKEKIRVILKNLIDNAIKYNKDGGSVSVSVQKSNSMVEVRIKDTGIGIPREDQKNIFAKSARAKNVEKKRAGTGLGLYIAKEFVLGHGGKIWFESVENEGSTFYFTLPIV